MYLRVRLFIRTGTGTCMFAYLRDVFEWFSFVRTPNIPTNIEVLSRVKKERKKERKKEVLYSGKNLNKCGKVRE